MKPLIAITAYNRPDILEHCLEQHKLYSKGIDIFVHYDDPNNRVGIPESKNACLLEFMNGDYTHCFLFDEDTFPLVEDWHIPYIESGFDHLCYTFYNPMRKHSTYNEYRLANGCMMMVTRNCVEVAGGFDKEFITGKFEHKEYSERIHSWGLTPCKFLDIPNSDKLIYCLDQKKGHQRSMSTQEMNELLKINYPVYLRKQKVLRRFVSL